MLLLTAHFVASVATPLSCSRRTALSIAAAPTSLTIATPAFADAAPTADRREAVAADLLSRVPAYLVTNSRGEPYLTDVDDEGKRSGSVFLGPADAAPLLEQVRSFDADASRDVGGRAALDLIWAQDRVEIGSNGQINAVDTF